MGTNKLSKGLKVDNATGGKELLQEHCNGMSLLTSEVNGVRESINTLKGSGVPVMGTRSTTEHMQKAVVAFAQAAAKANGEPEKYIPGWPLLSPLQKCDKCSREFCSPINYRRHIRVHRRSLNIDKDSRKNRDFLGTFWDKLSLDETEEIVSLKNVALEEVAGSSIIRALASFIRKPRFPSLPLAYVKAGAALLDVVQARPSRLPVSSQELFNILDGASEKTFLCAGTAVSMQKFVFDGEAGKIALEMKNLIACVSFLVEQKLVKAWVADKDAEALRCQKLLVEEEEAAQRRQAELLEKRRLKKLRQKEQKVKEQKNGNKVDFKETSPDIVVAATFPVETSSPRSHSDSESNNPEAPLDSAQSSLELVLSSNVDIEVDGTCHLGKGDEYLDMACGDAVLSSFHNSDPQEQGQQISGRRQLSVAQHPLQKPSRNVPNGFYLGQVPVSKSTALQKHGNYRDQRAASLPSCQKVWTRKAKLERQGESFSAGLQRDPAHPPDQIDNFEVLIGSISVALGDCSGHCQDDTFAASLDRCATDHQPSRRTDLQEKPAKPDGSQNNIANKSLGRYWRPVGRQEVGESAAIQTNKRKAQVYVFSSEAADRSVPDESYLPHGAIEDNGRTVPGESGLPHGAIADNGSWRNKDSATAMEGAERRGAWLLSSRATEALLAQRWKDAIADRSVPDESYLPHGAIADNGRTVPDESCLPHGAIADNGSWRCKDSATGVEGAERRGTWLLSSRAAEALLAQRWKVAIADRSVLDESYLPHGAIVDNGRTVPGESCLPHGAIADSGSWRCKDSATAVEGADRRGAWLLSSRAAEAFLAQRWKDAISSDHIKLVVSPERETEAPDCQENLDSSRDAPRSPSGGCRRVVLSNAENRLTAVGLVEPVAAVGSNKPKFRAKADKGCRLKYIPKNRNHA